MERVDYESLIIQDLLNFQGNGSLNIEPWYQRRSVWSGPQKAYLINTIFERKPVPSVYIRHQVDIEQERSIKEVVDGQQRIRTIISYRNDEFAAGHPNHNRKVRYSQLTNAQKRSFLQTALSVGYLIGAEDADVIEIFGRINSVSKTLNPQEKRNAQYSGDFKQFSLKQATSRLPFWRSTGIFSASQISRMQEVQFVSDLAINLVEGLVDFNAAKINSYYRNFDADFPEVSELRERFDNIFEQLAAIPPTVFSDTVFQQQQLAFSLMMVVDRFRDRESVNDVNIQRCMHDIDARVAAYRDLQVKGETESTFLEAFSGGNLHRIAKRRIRDTALTDALGQ